MTLKKSSAESPAIAPATVEQLRNATELNPDDDVPYTELGFAYLRKGIYPDTVTNLEKALALEKEDHYIVFDKAELAYAYASAGRKNEASKMLGELEEQEAKTLMRRNPRFSFTSGAGQNSIACVLFRDSLTLFAAWVSRNDKARSYCKDLALGFIRMTGGWAVLVCALIVPMALDAPVATARGRTAGARRAGWRRLATWTSSKGFERCRSPIPRNCRCASAGPLP